MSTLDSDYDAALTKYYHNNEKFCVRVIKKPNVREDIHKCWHCNQAFEEIIPHNIVLWYRGAWEYPIEDDNPVLGKRISSLYILTIIITSKDCVFVQDIHISCPIWCSFKMTIVQRALLASELKYTFN